MPRFIILPTDQSFSSAEISAPDAGAVLHTIGRLECVEADMLRDGSYAFSARLGANGLWTIYQRGVDAEHPCSAQNAGPTSA